MEVKNNGDSDYAKNSEEQWYKVRLQLGFNFGSLNRC